MLFCDLVQILALIKHDPFLMIPGFLTQIMIIIILLIDSIVLYIRGWSKPESAYLGLIPGLLGVLFLNFWIVAFNLFQSIWAERQRIQAQNTIDV